MKSHAQRPQERKQSEDARVRATLQGAGAVVVLFLVGAAWYAFGFLWGIVLPVVGAAVVLSVGYTYREEVQTAIQHAGDALFAEPLLTKPWREPEVRGLTGQVRTELIDQTNSHKPPRNKAATKILMMGPPGAGKSSYISTLHSAREGEMREKTLSGSCGESFTQMVIPVNFKLNEEGEPNLIIFDAPGLTEELSEKELSAMADGKATINCNFRHEGFLMKIGASEHVIDVAAMVIDATKLEHKDVELFGKLGRFYRMCADKGLPVVVILTHIQDLCANVESDLASVYRSPKVKRAVKQVANYIGIPENKVYPVENYSAQVTTGDDNDVLSLLVLRRMLRLAEDVTRIEPAGQDTPNSSNLTPEVQIQDISTTD